MAEIRYLCISDLHLGEEDSLLTNLTESKFQVDPTKPSPCAEKLAECLRFLLGKTNKSGNKPTLVLNGDVLEMALAKTHEAGMAFQSFMKLLIPSRGRSLFDEIYFLPGNHDHHLWEITRETQYTDFLGRKKQERELKDELPEPWHTTKLLCEEQAHPVKSYLLSKLIEIAPQIANVNVHVAYPNLGVRKTVGDREKLIVFHHGHFTEWIYWLMSEAKLYFFPNKQKPIDVWAMEAENFAWIDFFWSALGRSGEAGVGIEAVYEKLSYSEGFDILVKTAAQKIAEQVGPSWTDWFEQEAIEAFARFVYDRVRGTEKQRPECKLSDDALKKLFEYIQGPVLRQIARAMDGKDTGVGEQGPPIPTEELLEGVEIPETTFIFGHTHKPYTEYQPFEGFNHWVDVYNTGGWVVDTYDPNKCHGASVVLVDDDLNTASIRLFNEPEHEGEAFQKVFVEEAPRGFRGPNPLFEEIDKLVKPETQVWKSFTEQVASAVDVRRKHLRKRILTQT